MRIWVEKLTKSIEKSGYITYDPRFIGNKCIQIQHFRCNIRHFESFCNSGNVTSKSIKHLEIINIIDDTYVDIKLYDDECDILEKAIVCCINNLQDIFIKQFENFE